MSSEENITIDFDPQIEIKILPYKFCNKNFSLYLYTNVIKNMLLKLFNQESEYVFNNIAKNTQVKIIEDLDEVHDGDVLIFFSQHLSMDIIKDRIFNYMTRYTTIMINTEVLENNELFYRIRDYIDDIINRRGSPFVIWDCFSSNIRLWRNNFPYAYTYFIPLLYDNFLKETYEEFMFVDDEPIVKDIDILFIGNINDRANNILTKLKESYFVISIQENTLDFYKLVYLMQRSKVILNLFSEYNQYFDYLKNSFYIANKIFFVSELPDDYNFTIEDNLFGIKKALVTTDYDKMVNSIDIYLSLYNEDLVKVLTEKAHDWFKVNSYKAEENMVDCFSGIQTWGKISFCRL